MKDRKLRRKIRRSHTGSHQEGGALRTLGGETNRAASWRDSV